MMHAGQRSRSARKLSVMLVMRAFATVKRWKKSQTRRRQIIEEEESERTVERTSGEESCLESPISS